MTEEVQQISGFGLPGLCRRMDFTVHRGFALFYVKYQWTGSSFFNINSNHGVEAKCCIQDIKHNKIILATIRQGNGEAKDRVLDLNIHIL